MGKDIIGFLKRKYKERAIVKSEIGGESTLKVQREKEMLLLAHSLEKGLGLEEIRKDFGLDKANKLLVCLESYLAKGYGSNSFAYVESISVLDSYLKFSRENGTDVMDMASKLDKIMEQSKTEFIEAGCEIIESTSSMYTKLDIEAIKYFIESRHSIRSYEKKKVSEALMKKVIELAKNAPSACNRQPSKVYWTSDSDKVDKINKLIPGNMGFEDVIPNWAIIAVDKSLFNKFEYFQWYVNGGIFLSYFTEALHAYGIGSCIFQIPVAHENTSKLRDIASLSETEVIIAAIGFGYPKESIRVLAATRRPNDEICVKMK